MTPEVVGVSNNDAVGESPSGGGIVNLPGINGSAECVRANLSTQKLAEVSGSHGLRGDARGHLFLISLQCGSESEHVEIGEKEGLVLAKELGDPGNIDRAADGDAVIILLVLRNLR